jgi:hypothetical protein
MTANNPSQNLQSKKNALVAGWFSFEQGHATGGDILAMEVACDWLQAAGYDNYDVAYDPPFTGGVNWRTVTPADYSLVIFVCGPFEKKLYEAEFLTRFSDCRLVGLNLSIPKPLGQWNPFDLLYERNSTRGVRPDMVFLSKRPTVPVVGICLVEDYDGALVAECNTAIQNLIELREISIVYIDTRLDKNGTHLRTPAEIESLIARVDALVTTRLHGAVMALKNGVPVVPIDPEAGGAKIVDQMKKIGWPIVFCGNELDSKALSTAFDYCLTEEARIKARECRQFALNELIKTKNDFIQQLNHNGSLEENYRSRLEKKETPLWAKRLIEHTTLPNPVQKFNSRSILDKTAFLRLPGIVHYVAKRLRKL